MPNTDARPSDELHELADLAIDGGATEPMGLHLFATDDRRAELARHVERVVFGESFGNTPDLLAAEYGPYEAHSIFLCVLDYRRRLPAGMVRLILPDLDGSGLKTFDDIEPIWGVSVDELLRRSSLRMPLDRTWDFATLAVDPAYRAPAAAGLVSTALLQSVSQLSLRCRGRLGGHHHGPAGLPSPPANHAKPAPRVRRHRLTPLPWLGRQPAALAPQRRLGGASPRNRPDAPPNHVRRRRTRGCRPPPRPGNTATTHRLARRPRAVEPIRRRHRGLPAGYRDFVMTISAQPGRAATTSSTWSDSTGRE